MIEIENVYWTFSAAAQAIAAFIALLIAGYALVLSMMETAVKDDDSLIEINESLKSDYHKMLTILAILTAASIISCLAVIYFNKTYLWWHIWLERIAAILSIVSIVGGVYFVINIINPFKYRIKAISLSVVVKPKTLNMISPRYVFFEEFIKLESLVRKLWETKTDRGRISLKDDYPGFRQIIDSLVKAEVLPFKIYEDLLLINKYRNFVFHGRVEELDKTIVDRVIFLRDEINRLTTG